MKIKENNKLAISTMFFLFGIITFLNQSTFNGQKLSNFLVGLVKVF